MRSPDPSLDKLLTELELPPPPSDGYLRLMTTLTPFATAFDITLAELHLETDEATADVRRKRGSRW